MVARSCEITSVREAARVLTGRASDPQRCSTVYLHPGQIFVSPAPCTITTILGSCVSVCMWDPIRGIGGANHFLLPYGNGDSRRAPRFGNAAIGLLLQELLGLGCNKRRLRAKVYGGACVMEVFHGGDHLGLRNVQVGLELLYQDAIPVVAQDVGGRNGRRVAFNTHDGFSSVRLL